MLVYLAEMTVTVTVGHRLCVDSPGFMLLVRYVLLQFIQLQFMITDCVWICSPTHARRGDDRWMKSMDCDDR